MKISKAELQAALEKVKPGLASKEFIDQATSFAFIKGRVVTYNDEISISHPVKNLDVTGAVKADILYAYLNKVKQDEIHIKWEDNQVLIKAGKAKAGFVLEQEIRLPVEEIGEIGKWKDIPEDLLTALQFCAPCCSNDMSTPILTCLHVTGNKVQASDSYQIINYELSEKIPVNDFLLPVSTARILSRYNVKKIAQGEGWLHFKTDEGTVFSSRVFHGDYPDIEGILDFEGTVIDFPAKAVQALEKARVFSKGGAICGGPDVATVKVSLEKGELEFAAEDDAGWFKETAKIDYTGEKIHFTVSVEFLINLLDKMTSCVYGGDRIKFEGDNWIHVAATTDDE